jgi:hypothetical protein
MSLLIACGDDDAGGGGAQGKSGDGHGTSADGGDGGGGGSSDRGGGRDGKLPKDAPACLVSGATAEVASTNIDKLDMLFMIDNSNSMNEEQAALRSQFAHMIQVLTTGDNDADGESDFPAVKDLHLGVVSSDMGLLGVEGVDNCSGFGDDGILQHAPNPSIQGCSASYPTFLSFNAGVSDPNTTANDFACIATLGTGGCGFEQQLEATLKALWPSMDPSPFPDGSNRITFLPDQMGNGSFGHGDTDNVGFLRNDPTQGLSVIAVVVVTDEEDCSSVKTTHFTPPTFLDPSDPLAMQPLNLRCFFNKQNDNGDELYKLERYVNGFKALRPGNENLVVFAAITGVPADLVDAEHLAQVDFGDVASRDAFYAGILNDSRMQEVIDPASMTTPGTGNLIPSCNTEHGKAYPPRRIVEVAHQFGENGVVQSICQQDFGPVMDAIMGVVQKQLGAPCLPRSLSRSSDGLVGCDVVWELPRPDQAPASTPTECGQAGWEFLLEPDARHAKVTDRGGVICKLPQLAVEVDGSGGSLHHVSTKVDGETFAEGWYYDDFSESVAKECTGGSKQRIAFTSMAKPPTGVVVKLECLEQIPVTPPRTDVVENLEQPTIGSACSEVERNGQTLVGDAACAVRLSKPTKKWPDMIDKSMFCHPQINQCVLSCDADADCPDGWSCDGSAAARSAAGTAFCVAPSCSAGSEAASVSHVGRACSPQSIPEGGFDDRVAYLGTSDDESCGGGVCLVYHLRGDPREGCVSDSKSSTVCADPDEIAGRVYCSCRCDAPDGYAECKCPSGFSCQDVIVEGSANVAGGYCARNGT